MEFNHPTQEMIDALKAQFGNRFLQGSDINEDFDHDEMSFYPGKKPDGVVTVLTTEEVSDVCKLCYENNVPIVPRGAGTGLVGGCVALYGGIVIDLTKMNHILSYDLGSMVVRVEAGVYVNDLAEDCLKHGVMYAPDPGEKFATVGGNVATNAGGMRAVKYGTTRDNVKAMKVVLPDGQIMTFGAEVNKNCSGYSLYNLISGSEGTLAIITELSMKVLPLPGVTNSLLAPFEDLESCTLCVSAINQAGLHPQAVELMLRDNVESIENYLGEKTYPAKVDGADVAAYLLVTFDADNQDQLDEILEKAGDVFAENGALDVVLYDTADGLRKAWNVRGNALEALKAEYTLMDECDIVVPIPKIAELINYVVELGDEVGLEIRCTGHAGDGNIHINCCTKEDMDQDEFLKRVDDFMDKAYAKGIELGGLISGEHGIGYTKVKYLTRNLGEGQMRLMENIKKAFDPKMLLNPGKVCYSL